MFSNDLFCAQLDLIVYSCGGSGNRRASSERQSDSLAPKERGFDRPSDFVCKCEINTSIVRSTLNTNRMCSNCESIRLDGDKDERTREQRKQRNEARSGRRYILIELNEMAWIFVYAITSTMAHTQIQTIKIKAQAEKKSGERRSNE